MGSPTNKSTKKPDPLHPTAEQLHLVLDYHLLNKFLNVVHNVISYYPLPNITDMLARLQKCNLLTSLDLGSRYHHIGLNPEAKPKTAFATSGKWHWSVAPFGMCSLIGIFCYLMSQLLSGLNFCITCLDKILIYSTSWKNTYST